MATAAVSTFKPEHIRRFFEAHLGPLPCREQVSTRCIFHEDHSPSLSLNMEQGLWKCHAGCGEGGILDFQVTASPGADRETAIRLVNEACGTKLFGGKQPEAVYHYRDSQGRPLFQKLRYRRQDGGKYFTYRQMTSEGWVEQAEGIKKPLYNLPEILTADEIFITEGEKNADDLANALASLQREDVHVAVTTSHAGAGCWSDEYNGYFLAKKVVILADNDEPGRQHAERVAAALYPIAAGVKIVNLAGLQEKGDVSDYLPVHSVRDLLDQVGKTKLWSPTTTVLSWRTAFKSYGELEAGELEFLIDRVVPEGITFLGGLSGVGKTWLALSMAKAIVTGQSFLGNFRVRRPLPLIYLVPESGERAFRNRLKTMRMTFPEELLLCRTMGGGPTLALHSPEILEAVQSLKPVIVLDTAIRFSTADDENSAMQNQKLASEMFRLLNVGAKAIIAIHHSAKNSVKDGQPTLENTLRGTGDLGAIADAVYNLRCEDMSTLTLKVECVKARDFDPLPPFEIQGRPYLNQVGDFAMLQQPTDHEKVARAIYEDSGASCRDLAEATGISRNRITDIAESIGWKKIGRKWVQDRSKVQ